MASSSMKQLSMAILIIFSISLLQIQARDSMFFSKMQRNETEQVPKETPATANEEPMTFPTSDSGHGYGLYGHGPDEFSSSSTTTTADTINDAEKNDNYYRGRQTPSRFVNNEFKGDGYERQRYGMSDTRVLENGRYYYDVQAERSQNGYDPLSDQNSAGYTSYNGNGNGNEGYYYGYGGYKPGSDGNAHKEYNNARFGNQYNNEGQEYVP